MTKSEWRRRFDSKTDAYCVLTWDQPRFCGVLWRDPQHLRWETLESCFPGHFSREKRLKASTPYHWTPLSSQEGGHSWWQLLHGQHDLARTCSWHQHPGAQLNFWLSKLEKLKVLLGAVFLRGRILLLLIIYQKQVSRSSPFLVSLLPSWNYLPSDFLPLTRI